MGPGQGGSRSEWGWEEGNIQGRSLGLGQGGSQDYFAKKRGNIIQIRSMSFHKSAIICVNSGRRVFCLFIVIINIIQCKPNQ